MQVLGKAVIRKCQCGRIHHHGQWEKPDGTQVKNIAEAVNAGNVFIQKEVCVHCQPIFERE